MTAQSTGGALLELAGCSCAASAPLPEFRCEGSLVDATGAAYVVGSLQEGAQ